MTSNSGVATRPSRRDFMQNRSGQFRADIQGLRAIAVTAVVVYHLWPSSISGGFVGVDVFFVISGYLITAHLLRNPPARVEDFLTFWARRLRRLLPASLLVLVVVALVSWAVAPRSLWQETATQIVSSALYVENWTLSFQSVDYLAADDAASPVQHFWSLSVEEQFYLFWPLLIAILVYAGIRRGGNRLVVSIGVGAVVLGSLAFSAYYTLAQPASAYFVTPTRIWELGIGGLVAMVASSYVEKTGWLSALVAWIGLAGIVASVLWISPDQGFPGVIALVPVVSAALLILANARGRGSPFILLSMKPSRFVGDISYSIYLWHWPLIVLVPAVSGDLGVLDKLVIVVTTLVLAWLSYSFVENKLRQSDLFAKNGRTYVASAVVMVIAVTSGVGLWAGAEKARASSEASVAAALTEPGECVGAQVLYESGNECDIDQELIQDPIEAEDDKPDAYADGCWATGSFKERPTCTYGTGQTQVALVGNSHAGHWLPALQVLADARGWTITTFLVSRCSPSGARQAFDTQSETQGCFEYGQWVLEETTSGQFDAVITSERQSLPVEGLSWATTEDPAQAGYLPFLAAWSEVGLDVLVLRDTPFPGAQDIVVPDCVAANPDEYSVCNGSPESWYWMDPLAEAAESFEANTFVVDPTDWLCPDGVCRAVYGGLITYFDGSHLTASFARTLAPLINDEIENSGLASL